MSFAALSLKAKVATDFGERKCAYRVSSGLLYALNRVPQLGDLLGQLVSESFLVCLYGGASRALISCDSPAPRDFDFAVDCDALRYIERTLSRWSIAVDRNRFGGLRFRLPSSNGKSPVSVDCWDIERTWAFESKSLDFNSWRDLAKASVLDIDGAVIRILTETEIEIEAEPYLRASASNSIGLGLPHTYNWTIALFRVLSLAYKFDYAIDVGLQIELESRCKNVDGGLFRELTNRRFPSSGQRARFVEEMLYERMSQRRYTKRLSSILSGIYQLMPNSFDSRTSLPIHRPAQRQLTMTFDAVTL